MTLEVIITTMNDNIMKVMDNFFPMEENVIFLISHQITKQSENIYLQEINSFLNKRSDVRYFYHFEKGLSRNRNRSMDVSRGDICMVTDDDIVFKSGAFKTILSAFKELPYADIITFKTEFPDGRRYKCYKSKIVPHTFRSCMRISSFEIAYKRESIEKVDLKWDENFGLSGNIYTNHMENIFMVDALRRGLKAYFFPETLIIHPFFNSGFNYSRYMIFSKGAAFYKMFGKLAYILNFLYSVKKIRDYAKQFDLIDFNLISNKGANDFRKRQKSGDI